eukprot:2276268-Pleurochrysis_carterae.AAC.1
MHSVAAKLISFLLRARAVAEGPRHSTSGRYQPRPAHDAPRLSPSPLSQSRALTIAVFSSACRSTRVCASSVSSP